MKKYFFSGLTTVLFLTFATAAFCEVPDQRKEISLHYYRGVVYFESGRYNDALTEFQKVSNIDPYYKDTSTYMEKSVKTLEQYREEALGIVSDKKLKDKGDFDLYFMGKSYYEKGDFENAAKTFRAVLDKNPEDKFAQYYLQLSLKSLPKKVKIKAVSKEEEQIQDLNDLETEIAYIKSDIREQEDVEKFLREKAVRRAARDEVIRAKERQLKEQEDILEEEKADYLTQAKITKETEKLKNKTEKWRSMKEKLASNQPGVPAELIDYPQVLNAAEEYYKEMNEALRTSRWNAAGLSAIGAAINFSDAILIYFYNIRSAAPRHENVTRLLLENVKRSDTQSSVYHLRAILNMKRLIDNEDRPITRTEALFLSDHAEKIAEWAKSVLP
ncbi:MAG TPA: tetratricopeptide repeat protein [Candidatus Omnitrophota bacterium]|nr:tetratricopeptide repeat protein [Candidatus Omnitrophota bacterium]